MVAQAERANHFSKQLFSSNRGMNVLIAGEMDFPSPAGLPIMYEQEGLNPLYIQAFHRDFARSKYITGRMAKSKNQPKNI